MARDAYVLSERRVIIFWSRKAGNTSLAEWLVQGLGLKEHRRNKEKGARRVLKKAGQKLHIDGVEALPLIRNEGFEDFVLARNPFHRVVSAYVEKFLYYRSKRLDSFDQLKGFAGSAYIEAMVTSGRSDSGAYQGLSFAQFLEYLVAKIRSRAKSKEPDLNHHWSPQVPMAFDGRFTYRNVLRLESIAQDIQVLARKLEWDVPFPMQRKNEPPGRIEDCSDLSEVSSIDLVKEGIVPRGNALLNSKTKELIREIYEIDFRMLGYDPGKIDQEMPG